MALWHIRDDDEGRPTGRLRSSYLPEYGITQPVVKEFCKKSEKIRALAHNSNKKVGLLFKSGCTSVDYDLADGICNGIQGYLQGGIWQRPVSIISEQKLPILPSA